MATPTAERYEDTDGDSVMVVTYDDGTVTLTNVSAEAGVAVTVLLTHEQVDRLHLQLNNAF